MIAVYDETWQMYVRREQLTARRSDYLPYCINRSLYDFLNSADDKILDIGCGENNLKLFWPDKIHGVDRTLEADTYAFVGDPKFHLLPKFKYGVAVNSLHFGNVEHNIARALAKCSKMWISLNNNRDLDRFDEIEYWQQFGNVEYFWHGRNPETQHLIKKHLENDMNYAQRVRQFNRDINQDVQTIYNQTVLTDTYFGVTRAVVSIE